MTAGSAGGRPIAPVATRQTGVSVMAGLVPAIHVFLLVTAKTWMPGTSPGTTVFATSPH